MASGFAASLAARQVYLRIKPFPRRIHDTKEILKTLQKYGEVMTYRNLRYEKHVYAPNAVLVIFQSEKAAQDALAAAPLHLHIPGPSSWRPSPLIEKGSSSPENDESIQFTVAITPSYYNHARGAEKNPYSGHWRINTTVSYQDLERQVPMKEHANCSPTRDDLDQRTIYDLRKEAEGREGLMDLWRRGLQKQEDPKP